MFIICFFIRSPKLLFTHEYIYVPSEIIREILLYYVILLSRNIPKIDCLVRASWILRKGRLYSCGIDDYGNNVKFDQPRMQICPIVHTELNIIDYSNGVNHNLFLTEDGLYAQGSNNYGQLGMGHFTTLVNGTLYKIEQFSTSIIISLCCGGHHSFVLTKECLFGSGMNDCGQLGLGNFINAYSFKKIDISNVISISCGFDFSLVLTKEGLFGCGDNSCGAIGLDYNESYKYSTLTMINIDNVISFDCGFDHSFILTIEGLFVCGGNLYGQLGLGLYNILSHTYGLKKPPLSNVISFSCGYQRSFVLTKEGLFGCGYNDFGQLGLGDVDYRNSFTKINITNVISFKCGGRHSLILTKEGLFGSGSNTSVQLGMIDESLTDMDDYTYSFIKIDTGNLLL